MRLKDVRITLDKSGEIYTIRIDEEKNIKSYFKSKKQADHTNLPKQEDLTNESIGTLEGKLRKGEQVIGLDKEGNEIKVPHKIFGVFGKKVLCNYLKGEITDIYTFSEKWISGGYDK